MIIRPYDQLVLNTGEIVYATTNIAEFDTILEVENGVGTERMIDSSQVHVNVTLDDEERGE